MGSLDQTGLLEMKSMPESTGGYKVMSDSYQNAIFKKSFIKVFDRDDAGFLKQGFLHLFPFNKLIS